MSIKLTISTLTLGLLTACTQTYSHEKQLPAKALQANDACLSGRGAKCPPATPFNDASINQYVQVLIQDLIANLDYAQKHSVFGVTNFVWTDSDLKTLPFYSHHISDAIQHELHMFGLLVQDFKSTGALQVTPEGDFFRSRDYKELKGRIRMDYVVAGTLTKLTDGILVNAKVVGTESLALVSSSQVYIPQRVLDRIVHSQPVQIKINE